MASAKPAKTEQRNPRSRGLARKSTLEIVQILNREDATVAKAVSRELPKIARAADKIVQVLSRGGRLIYVGAGTSGRLAVLDAAECPPTFGTPPQMVQAIIAGGNRALRYAAEDAEDSAAGGARDLSQVKITKRDVLVGISASGTTPYVLGALKLAKKRGAFTLALTSNRNSPIARQAHILIAPETGPEAIAGSTRLKAGTAQKMILNLLSSAAMARMGRIYDNWMIHVALTNAKLRRRGAQILQESTGASAASAKRALRQSNYNLPTALIMLKAKTTAQQARRALVSTGGNIQLALKAPTS